MFAKKEAEKKVTIPEEEKKDEEGSTSGGRLLILAAVDGSGSMSGQADATVRGLNQLMDSNDATKPEFVGEDRTSDVFFGMYVFNTRLTWCGAEGSYSAADALSNVSLHRLSPIRNAKRLAVAGTPESERADRIPYTPEGGTALYDGIGLTIRTAEAAVSRDLEESEDDNTRVLIIVQTDGAENSSTMFSKTAIRDLIRSKEELGWRFVFLGANQDAVFAASEIGIAPQSALTYTVGRTPQAFASVTSACARWRDASAVTGRFASPAVAFSTAERMASDQRDPRQRRRQYARQISGAMPPSLSPARRRPVGSFFSMFESSPAPPSPSTSISHPSTTH